jgi:hypothetical protein
VATLREVCPYGVDNEDKASAYLHQQVIERVQSSKAVDTSETRIRRDRIVLHQTRSLSAPVLELSFLPRAPARMVEKRRVLIYVSTCPLTMMSSSTA